MPLVRLRCVYRDHSPGDIVDMDIETYTLLSGRYPSWIEDAEESKAGVLPYAPWIEDAEEPPQADEGMRERILLGALDVDDKTMRYLEAAGIQYIDQVPVTVKDLVRYKGIGRVRAAYIIEALDKIGG